MSVENLTSETFDSVAGEGCALVDFWAAWCMPCRMVAPTIEELAEEFDEKVTVGKVNVDNDGALAARFGIMSIPTVILLRDGKEVKRFIGVQSKDVYADALRAEV